MRPHGIASILTTCLLAGGCGDDPASDGDTGASGISDSGINITGTTGDFDEDDETGDLLDVGAGGGGPDPTAGGDCPGSGGMTEDAYSIIWIANSPEGTVSKIDTRTQTELARY